MGVLKLIGKTGLLSSLLVLTCCAIMRDQYNIVHLNSGTLELDGVRIVYQGFESVCGVLPPRISKDHMWASEEAPIPAVATVKWVTTVDGVEHEKRLKVKEQLPKGRFKGDLVFVFHDDDVSLSWRKK